MDLKTKNMDTKIASVAIVMCLAAVSIGGAILVDEDTEDSDAIIVGTLLFAGIIIAAYTAGIGTYALYDMIADSGNTADHDRQTEALTVATSILNGMTYYSNALANYDQIWKLTDEHWIRQAELAASFLWSSNSDYDPSKILTYSETYQNCAYMLENASAQINAHFTSLSERMKLWNQTDTYKDMMSLKWSYGSSGTSSNSSFDGHLYAATTVSLESADTVFVTGGDLWVFGGSATMAATDGTTIILQEGCNDLDSTSTFTPGEYDLQTGRQYAGFMLPTLQADSASVTTGLVMQAGSSAKLATYNATSDKIIVDGVQYDSLSIKVIPSTGTTATADITSILSDYYDLLNSIKSSLVKASNAAMTVWNIYDKAGSASSYLTTLTVPETYENVEITQSQQEVITILALEQLSEYYSSNSGAIKTGNYTMSNDSLTLYCRGSIYDKNGEKLYDNVIFTPFFYHSDTTLNNGENDLTQSCIVAIWSNDGSNLSGWGSTDINDTNLITLSSGETLDIYEMMYDGNTVSTMDLVQNNIDIIEAGAIDPNPITPYDGGETNYLQLILIIVGALGIVAGLVFRRVDFVVIGIAAIAVGWLAGSWLWDLIS